MDTLFSSLIPIPRLERITNFSSGRDYSGIPEEYDNSQRDVELWLYTSSVGSSSTNNDVQEALRPLMALSMSKEQYEHWILVFEFCDETVRAIEGANEDNELKPNYFKYRDSSWLKCFELGTLCLSPCDVRSMVMRNPYNFVRYSVADANCHHWVNAILEMLNIKPLSNTIQSDIRWKTVAAAATIVHPLVGLGVLQAQNLFNLADRNSRRKN